MFLRNAQQRFQEAYGLWWVVSIQRCLWLCRGEVAARHGPCERAALHRAVAPTGSKTLRSSGSSGVRRARIDEGTSTISRRSDGKREPRHADVRFIRCDDTATVAISNHFDYRPRRTFRRASRLSSGLPIRNFIHRVFIPCRHVELTRAPGVALAKHR